MAVLQKLNILGNERLDLTDFSNIEAFTCADFGQVFQKVFTSTSEIIRGFKVFQDSGLSNPLPTISPVFVQIDGSAILHTSLSTGPTFFVGATGAAPVSIALTAASKNYIELSLSSATGSPDNRSFWDQTALPAPGSEFSQVIDTVTYLNADITVNTLGFTGGDKISIAEIELDGGGNIIGFYDNRNLFGSLGRANPFNALYQFPFSGGRSQALHTIVLTGGAGTFISGETVIGSISAISAKVVSGGTTNITIAGKSASTFHLSPSAENLVGQTSGASRQLVSAKEDFNSGDKSILSFKDTVDALMTEILRMKFGTSPGNHYWFEDGPASLSDLNPLPLFMDQLAGSISWTAPNFTFSGNFTIPITGTAFVNTITTGNSPIVLNNSLDLAYVNVNKSANVNLTPIVVAQVNYVPLINRYIIARRIGTSLMVYDRIQ